MNFGKALTSLHLIIAYCLLVDPLFLKIPAPFLKLGVLSSSNNCGKIASLRENEEIHFVEFNFHHVASVCLTLTQLEGIQVERLKKPTGTRL